MRDQWTLRAACLHADPELFFTDVFGAVAATLAREAKQCCAGCPVRADCLEWAISTGEAYGIWGGTTPDERRVIRARLRQQVDSRLSPDVHGVHESVVDE